MKFRNWLIHLLWLTLICEHAATGAENLATKQPADAELSAARAFDEPLVPLSAEPNGKENQALAEALAAYAARVTPDDCSSLAGFADNFPQSRWTASLLLNLGVEYYNYGYFSKALDAWQRSWTQYQTNNFPPAKAQADRALGELARMFSRIGRGDQLSALLDSVKDRDLAGPGSQLVHSATEALWIMQNKPDYAFGCGPSALDRILLHIAPSKAGNPVLLECKSGTNGFSLSQVVDISQKLGMNYQMAYRPPGASLIVPSVVHWKIGHYAAVIEQRGDRILIQDSTFPASLWVSARALNEESSGYFVVPSGQLPGGWRVVPDSEGQTVWGRGQTAGRDPNATCPCRDKSCGGSRCKTCGPCNSDGMATYSMHALLTSLTIQDTPVRFDSPVGPQISFTATYNQSEANQPASFYYSNLGPSWDCSWLCYVTDNPTSPNADVSIYMDGGGTLLFPNYNTTTHTYAAEPMTQALLVKLTTNSYEMQFPNGARRQFSQSDGATGSTRRIFLTKMIDPFGNAEQFSYDAQLRITNIANAIGQGMTLLYTNTSFPFAITSVIDPFGRSAQLLYNANGLLIQITDVLGLTSQFTYGANQFITAMTTPYGTTRFSTGTTNGGTFLTATDPLGGTEALEYSQSLPVPHGLTNSEVPHGLSTFNLFIDARNSFFWDKKAFAEGPWDWTKSHIYHWLHQSPSGNQSARILESEKDPLEARVWYNYPGQSTNFGSPYYLDAAYTGASSQPTVMARVLDDGTTQLYSHGYNDFGNVTNSTDPLGRNFTFVYASNNIDLLQMYMSHNGKHELLGGVTYNAQHLPVSTTDPSGQVTTTTYNSRGQVLTITNPKNEITTFGYDANGFLISIQGPLGASTTATFTYDAFNHIHTSTDTEGYTVTYAYDVFDRPTLITFPDGTTQQFVYDRLDLVAAKDPLDRWTTNTFDANRRLLSTRDPLGRVTRYEWCTCGLLEGVIDPMGRKTTFTYDLQSRLTKKLYPDGSFETQTYEAVGGRPLVKTDASGNQMIMEYNLDDTLKRISYAGNTNPTPPVSFTYDPDYNRLATVQDGIGTTVYAYYPITQVPALGAGQLQSLSGPLPNSTVTYQYDEVRRVVNCAINGVGQTVTFDALGRPTMKTNALGAFRYSYLNTTTLLTAAALPNGQTNLYSYYDIPGDQRLKQITYLKPDSSVLSSFGYGYNAIGQISRWTNGWDTLPTRTWTLNYDAADQLAGAVQTGGPTVPATNAYAYDPAGNRTQASTGAATNAFSYNNLNQLETGDTGPATPLAYEWDAANRLVAISQGTHRTEFTYDGLGRRTRIVEKEGGSVVGDNYFLWCGGALCEERDATGSNVVRRFFAQGESIVGATTTNLYYTRDHLGSIREVLNANGALQARYDYDLYGQQTLLSGTAIASFGFTGHFKHQPSGLYLSLYRALDPRLGRWLSRDPLGEGAGLNLYAYVGNNPINLMDPLGLKDGLTAVLEFFNDGSAGFADTITFGATSKIRGWIYGPCGDGVDKKSWTYWGGARVGDLWLSAAGGAAIGKAKNVYSAAKIARAARAASVASEAGAASWVAEGEGAAWVAESSEGASWVAESGEAGAEAAGRTGADTVLMKEEEFLQMKAAETAAREAAATPAMRYLAAERAFNAWMKTAGSCATAENQAAIWKLLAGAFGFKVP